jgi:signal transduction histidine kinase
MHPTKSPLLTDIPLQHSIVTRLLRIVFFFYLLAAVVITLVQMIFLYYDTKDGILAELQFYQESFGESLAGSLWNFDQKALKTTLSGLLKIQHIAGITVRDDTNKVLASVGTTLENDETNQVLDSKSSQPEPANQHQEHHFIRHAFKLFYHDGNHLEPVGEVTLYSTTELVFKELWLEYVLVIISAILKTILLWAFFLWFGYRLLHQPLYRLTRAVQQIDLVNLVPLFAIEEQQLARNELNVLQESFNGMIGKLSDSLLRLESAQQEVLVKQVRLAQEEEAKQAALHYSKTIESKNQELNRLNQEKNEFLGIVAHDLKNPLSGIKGLSEYIQELVEDLPESDTSAEISSMAKQIQHTAERMFRLIINLLDVNAIESGKFNLNFEAIDFKKILREVIQHYQAAATDKNLTLSCVVDTNSNYFKVWVDKHTLYQIFENLVSNAIKYSPLGKAITVNIYTTSRDTVRCDVQDQGPGLSLADQQKLFGKFNRLSAQPTGGEHSNGLGLFIVKKLISAMNGKVWCESNLGQGATFCIELPLSYQTK